MIYGFRFSAPTRSLFRQGQKKGKAIWFYFLRREEYGRQLEKGVMSPHPFGGGAGLGTRERDAVITVGCVELLTR